MARYALYDITIIGCMIGYGHTLLAITFKRDPIRYVDFTPTAWVVNLICYGFWARPVFDTFALGPEGSLFLEGGVSGYVKLFTEVFLNILYTFSILNMGTKFGVMVDKGLVDTKFFSVVRHPSYTLESLMFVTIYLSTIEIWRTPGLLAFVVMYWIRSERDDHFMTRANDDYAAYRERVPYKFIPGLW